MEDVTIIRIRQSDQGTEGILISDDFKCFTLELPWKDNQPNISCIPTGEYQTTIRVSPHFGRVYWVTEVEGRSYILIHAGNWAGDISKDYITNTYGCILLGQKRGILSGQKAVLLSRPAIRKFMDKLQGQDFNLHIISALEGE